MSIVVRVLSAVCTLDSWPEKDLSVPVQKGVKQNKVPDCRCITLVFDDMHFPQILADLPDLEVDFYTLLC